VCWRLVRVAEHIWRRFGVRRKGFTETDLIWSVLKRSLANLAKHDITQLTALVKSPLRRMQCRPDLTAGVLAGTRLDLTPL
jgi:hypothetical protein